MIPLWAEDMEHGQTPETSTLWAPRDFWDQWEHAGGRFHQHVLFHGCNGCGTRDFDVPDTMWGLRVTICCNIHDFMCARSATPLERRWTDGIFFQNLLAYIHVNSNIILRPLRRERACLYFKGVLIGSAMKDPAGGYS